MKFTNNLNYISQFFKPATLATQIFVVLVCTDSTPNVQKMSSMLKLTGVLL